MKLFSLFGEVFFEDEKVKQGLDDIDEKGEKAEARFGSMDKAVGVVVGSLALMGVAALLAMGVKGVSSAEDFNKAMNGLASETGATNDEMAGFEDIATRIYNNNFGEDFEDIAKAMAQVKTTTGATGEELEKMTTNALMLRDTFEFDVNASVNTANSLMKNFGISGDEAFTLIAQGAQNGANKNGDLLEVLNEYSPQFKALGFDAEDFTDILIQGSKDGAFQIDKVGDAIKEFTIRSKDLSDTSLEAFDALGMNGEEMSAQFAAGGTSAQTAFQQVMDALGSVEDPLEQNAIGVALFGTQFEDLEATAILSLGNVQATVDQNASTLQDINNIKYDTFGEALTGIGRNLETGILIPLGEKILPKLAEFAEWIIANMPEIQSNVNAALDVVTGLFDDFAVAIQWVIDNGDILLPIIIGLTAAIAAQAVIGTITKLMKAWSTATKTQTTVQWLLNAALNANPLGLIALAIGAVVTAGILLWKNWDTVKEKAGKFWAYMKDVVKGPVNFILGAVNSVISSIEGMINGLGKAINSVPDITIPDWVPKLGGKSFGIPDISTISLPKYPMLAEGGNVHDDGAFIVGENGPELFEDKKGARVTPLDHSSINQPQVIHTTINVDGRKVAEATSRPNNDMVQTRQRGTGVLSPA